MEKIRYEKPVVEVTEFEAEDIITASGGCGLDCCVGIDAAESNL